MIEYVSDLEDIFHSNFTSIITSKKPFVDSLFKLSQDKEAGNNITCSQCLTTGNVEYTSCLFFRVRLYGLLKRQNALMQSQKTGKRNRKVMKLLHI